MYPDFELVVPDVLDDALEELSDTRGSVAPIAGGTNLMIDMRAGLVLPRKVVSLSKIAGFKETTQRNGVVEISGGTTISDVLYSKDFRDTAPALYEAAGLFAGQMVRNTGTVAGNVCSGSPAADMVPPLLTLDAILTLESTQGVREVPLSEFYTGLKQDVKKSDELVTKISWNRPPEGAANRFYKLGLRKGDAITVVGVAVLLTVVDGICRKARIAYNSVAPVVKRSTSAEAMLEGQALSEELINEAAIQSVKDTSPISDIRASSEYRAHCTGVLVRRLLVDSWTSLKH